MSIKDNNKVVEMYVENSKIMITPHGDKKDFERCFHMIDYLFQQNFLMGCGEEGYLIIAEPESRLILFSANDEFYKNTTGQEMIFIESSKFKNVDIEVSRNSIKAKFVFDNERDYVEVVFETYKDGRGIVLAFREKSEELTEIEYGLTEQWYKETLERGLSKVK